MTRTPFRSTSISPGDVLGCLQELGIEVARISNGEAWAYCPGHLSRTGEPNHHPNKWSINIDSGMHSCFSCGFKGSFAYLVMEVLEYERDAAEQWVRRRGGIAGLDRILAAPADREPEQPRVRPWNEARLALFDAPPESARDRRGISAGAVEHYGVLWNSDKEYWILPIRDPKTGSLWGYQEKGDGWFCNKPGGVPKGHTLFGIDCLSSTTIIVVESPLDCLRIHSAGITGAVATYGAQITDQQMELLFDRAETVIFALDNDKAGINKMVEIHRKYLRSGKRIRFANYSHISWAKDLGTEGVTDSDIHKAFGTTYNVISFPHDFQR